jgi:hypothetical protein
VHQGELSPLQTPTASISLVRELSIMSVGHPLLDIALVAASTTQHILSRLSVRPTSGRGGSEARDG